VAKVLVADDDENVVETLQVILERGGHQVRVARDGRAALEAAVASPPDLLLLDIMMPEKHGYAVCHEIKSHPALKGIKVLILSSKSFPADRRQAEGVGADGFLSKPVRPDELLEKIRSLLA
jgi:two-component system, OmpR family, alkaline phosphatase synthesis response regulator PhoP